MDKDFNETMNDEIEKEFQKIKDYEKRELHKFINDSTKNDEIRIRINKKDKEALQKIAQNNYFETLSDYLRYAGFRCSSISDLGNMVSCNKLNNEENLKLENILRKIDYSDYGSFSLNNIVLIVNKRSEKQYFNEYLNNRITIITIEEYLNNSSLYSNKCIVIYPSVLLSVINENMNLRQDINLLETQLNEINNKELLKIDNYLNSNSHISTYKNMNNILMFAYNNEWNIEEKDERYIKYIIINTYDDDKITYIYDKQHDQYFLQEVKLNANDKYSNFKEYLLTFDNKEDEDIKGLLKVLGYDDGKIKLCEKDVLNLKEYFKSHEDHWIVKENIGDSSNGDSYLNINIESFDLSLNVYIKFHSEVLRSVFDDSFQCFYDVEIFVKENSNIEWINHDDLNDVLSFLNSNPAYNKLSDKINSLANRKIEKLLIKKERLNKSDYDSKLQMAVARKDVISIEKYIKKASNGFMVQLLNDAFTNNTTLYYTDNIRREGFMQILVRLLLDKKIKFDPYVAILYSINTNDIDLLEEIIDLLKNGYKIKSDYFSNKIDKEKPLKGQLLNDSCQMTIGAYILHLFDYGKQKDATTIVKKLHDAGFILNLPLVLKSEIYTDEVINLFKSEFGSESFSIFKKNNLQHMKDDGLVKIVKKIEHNEDLDEDEINIIYEYANEHEEDMEIIDYQNNLLDKSREKIVKIRNNEVKEEVQKVIPLD